MLRTVLGDLDDTDLGYVQSHDHVFVDGRGNIPDDLLRSGDPNVLAPVGQANYMWVRRNYFNVDNFLLDEPDVALRELLHYRRAGGGALVDSTCIGMGRRPTDLAEVSRRSGVAVVLGTGFYVAPLQPAERLALTIDEMVDTISTELTRGIGDTGVRAGFVGEVGMSWPVREFEERSLIASARVQQDMGVAVQVHPGRDERAPIDIVERFVAAGGDVGRVIICHIDRTLADPARVTELAATGCTLEFDLFGRESSHYPMSDFDMPNDAGRVARIRQLIDEGARERILIGQDVSKKVHLKEYGGEGYGHILENVVPLMARRGFTEAEIRAVTRDNPLRAFAFPQ